MHNHIISINELIGLNSNMLLAEHINSTSRKKLWCSVVISENGAIAMYFVKYLHNVVYQSISLDEAINEYNKL